MKHYALPLSIVFLGLSIFASSVVLSSEAESETKTNIIDKNAKEEPPKQVNQQSMLMTREELANYLGIPEEKVRTLLLHEIDGLDTGMPYIKIENTYYFPRQAINQWILTGESMYSKEF